MVLDVRELNTVLKLRLLLSSLSTLTSSNLNVS